MRKRNIVLWVIASILTLGIAGIVWFAKLTSDANYLCTLNDKDDAPLVPMGEQYTTGCFVALLLTLVTFGLYSIYWGYKVSKVVYFANKSKSDFATDFSIINLILTIVGWGLIVVIILQNELNTFAESEM